MIALWPMKRFRKTLIFAFVRNNRTRILRELAHMRQDDQARDVAIAALSADLKITKEGVEGVRVATEQNY